MNILFNDKRAAFFLLSAIVCLALLPVCLPEFRWVGVSLVVVQLVLCVLSIADGARYRRRS